AADDDADTAAPITEADGAPTPELPQQPPVQSAAPAPGGNGRAQREDGFAEPLPMGGGEPDPFGPEGSFARGWEEVRHEFSVAGMDATPLPPPAPPEDTPEPGPIPGARADQAAAPLSAVPLAAALPVSPAPVVPLPPPPPAAAPAPPAPPPPVSEAPVPPAGLTADETAEMLARIPLRRVSPAQAKPAFPVAEPYTPQRPRPPGPPREFVAGE